MAHVDAAKARNDAGEAVEIGEIPDHDLYERRRLRLYPDGDPDGPLPTGFPLQTSSAAVWSGQDLNLHDLIIELSAEDVHEIEVALAKVKGSLATSSLQLAGL